VIKVKANYLRLDSSKHSFFVQTLSLMPHTKLMSFFICATLFILFTSTLIQGHDHDNFDVNTADNILSSSSELENSLRQHNNPIRIGKCSDHR
jgi:hypothetical protein